MKFVYPYKYRYNYFEIEHSVRWLYLAYPDAEVYIIGDKPQISSPFIHIPYESYLPYSGCDVTDKVMTFCKMIGDEFILMNDDFFITEKFPLHQVMYYDFVHINPSHSITYQRACEHTIDWLTHHYCETYSFECHQPVHIQSSKFIELFEHIHYQAHNHLLKSIYFNVWPPRKYEGSNLKFGYSLTKAKEALEKYGAFSCSEEFLTAENKRFISMYSGPAELPPSAGCLLCQTPVLPLD